MYLNQQKSCNLLPKIEKINKQMKTKQKCKQMWEMESAKQGRCHTLQEKIEKKSFSKS